MTPLTNPYIVGGKNTVLTSFCVYSDILGFQEETINVFKNDKGQELLDKLSLATSHTYNFIKDKENNLWQHKIFTDNIVLGFPIKGDGEGEFGILIGQLIEYQFSMALEGFFIRGAFTIGGLHVSEEIVYGPAVIEAYQLEKEITNNPRIIFSETVMRLVKKHLKYYADPKESPQNSTIMIDNDNQPFINYLFTVIENDEGVIDEESLKKHKQIVEDKLRCFKKKSYIWSKYLWVANYHNYFCKLIKKFPNFKNEFFIDSALMVQEPKMLIE